MAAAAVGSALSHHVPFAGERETAMTYWVASSVPLVWGRVKRGESSVVPRRPEARSRQAISHRRGVEQSEGVIPRWLSRRGEIRDWVVRAIGRVGTGRPPGGKAKQKRAIRDGGPWCAVEDRVT